MGLHLNRNLDVVQGRLLRSDHIFSKSMLRIKLFHSGNGLNVSRAS